MRLASIRVGSRRAIGVVGSDLATVRVLPAELGTVDDVVRGRLSLDTVTAWAEGPEAATPVPLPAWLDPDWSEPVSGRDSGRDSHGGDLVLEAPLATFNRDILCTGWNYLDHFYESAGKREGQDPAALPTHPTFFTKGPDTVIGPHDPIAHDEAISAKWDYEAELALVIGRAGRSIREEDAWSHVFGVLLANDVSQRDLQRAHGGQWLKGKSIDQTMPLGPWITTLDELGEAAAGGEPHDWPGLTIGCRLNGEPMQSATAGEMAFSVPRLIAELSHGMTLRPGDVLLTGTPSGIGNAREPAVFLKPGDVVVTEGGPLGRLRNEVRSISLH